MKRRLLVIAAAAVALAAGSRGLFRVPEDQVVANRLAWMELDAPGREQVRAAWQRVQGSTGVERERLLRRMETLSRMQVAHRRKFDQVMDAETLDRELAAIPVRVEAELDRLEVGPGDVAERLQRRSARRLGRFLDNLVAAGRLEVTERDRLQVLPWDTRLTAGLELQKREEIFFLSEARDPAPVAELAELQPLDVVAQARDGRRRQGFLGRVSAMLGLTTEDRALLADVPDERIVPLLRELMIPKARALLEARDVEPARIESILAKPYRDLERSLDALVRSTPTRR